jgi:hypothetical protein
MVESIWWHLPRINFTRMQAKLQKMDNEASSVFKSYFTEKYMIYTHIATGTTPLSAPSGFSRNTLWQACPQ